MATNRKVTSYGKREAKEDNQGKERRTGSSGGQTKFMIEADDEQTKL